MANLATWVSLKFDYYHPSSNTPTHPHSPQKVKTFYYDGWKAGGQSDLTLKMRGEGGGCPLWNYCSSNSTCGGFWVLTKNVLIPVSDEDIFAQEARVKEARQKLAMAVKALGWNCEFEVVIPFYCHFTILPCTVIQIIMEISWNVHNRLALKWTLQFVSITRRVLYNWS